MKKEYLLMLKELLDRYDMPENEKEDILEDYSEMYDNYKERGVSEEEIQEKLGKPKSVIAGLVEGYRRIPKPSDSRHKLIAVSPFISLVVFFVLGFGFGEWVYSWMSFLLIPVTAIIVEMSRSKDPHITTALSPFIATVAFYILGMHYGLWHPGWAVFLIIPILGVFNSRKEMNTLALLTALSPFAAVVAYIYIGELGYYHPGWLILFVVPFVGAIHEKTSKMLLIWLLIAIGVGGYLYLDSSFDFGNYSLLTFAPLALFYLLQSENGLFSPEVPKGYKITVAASVVTYFLVSFLTGAWEVTWLIFFAIPVYAINREVEGSEKQIALTPFIATTIFMLVGFFFSAWAWSWLAFLIIPIWAIIKEA